MRNHDARVRELAREARDGEEPVENGLAVSGDGDEGDEAEGDLERDAVDGPAGLVDLGEDGGGAAGLGEGLEDAG